MRALDIGVDVRAVSTQALGKDGDDDSMTLQRQPVAAGGVQDAAADVVRTVRTA